MVFKLCRLTSYAGEYARWWWGQCVTLHTTARHVRSRKGQIERSTDGKLSVNSSCASANMMMGGQGIVKSENDTRDYRAIQLPNGLTALLISDMMMLDCCSEDSTTCSESNTATDKADDDSMSSESESDNDMQTDEDDEDDISEDDIADRVDEAGSKGRKSGSGKDDKHRKHGERMSVPVSRTSSSSSDSSGLSAAALCIGVGSFCDPPDIPGLAHFLEHMVFMGSEKYPDENDFDAYVKQFGGNSNAYTECESTVFYFDIQQKNFREALDRFAHFFIKPLLKRDSMEREILAVDSEFDMNLQSDNHRKEQLMSSMAKAGHPMNKFMWGNKYTLKELPAQNSINIHNRLKRFHRVMYGAQFMTLAVQARETLDTLQEWVTDIFSPIPNNKLTRPPFNIMLEPFDTAAFYKLYKVIPVKNIHEVELCWGLPPQLKHYRVKPLAYLGWLIGHEGAGSILSYLKKRLWAVGLTSGNTEGGWEHNSTWASFSISIVLTEEGIVHVFEVLTSVFEYLAMLKQHGPVKRIYEEIQTIELNEFRWQEQIDAVDYVENLCDCMQYYSVEDYLTGDDLFFKYDESVIAACQDGLIPRKVNIMLFSNSFEEANVCDMTEYWFKTPYRVEDIPEKWYETWEKAKPNGEFHLPMVNEYIATDFSLKETDRKTTMFPVKITDTDQSRLWYMHDRKFNVPKAYVSFILQSSCVTCSPFCACLTDLFLKVLAQNLTEVAYAADAAQLSYAVTASDNGLVIKLNGFNHKLSKLFETIIDYIASFSVTDEMFVAMKEQLQKTYNNSYLRPSRLVTDVRLSLLQSPYWMALDKQQFLQVVSKQMLIGYVQQLTGLVFVEGLIQGNITSKEAHELESYMLKQLKCKPLSQQLLPELRIVSLPVGETCARIQSFNQDDSNSVIVNYYQFGTANLRDYTMNELLTMRMDEPCFDILRTREQLGYGVFCTNHNTCGIMGISVTVYSQADKFSMDKLDKHIENFMKEFSGIINAITQKEFETLLTSLSTLKKCEDTHLGEEVERNWSEVLMQTYNYDYLYKQLVEIESFTLQEFRDWFKKFMPGSVKYRKLTVQIVGHVKEKDKSGSRSPSPWRIQRPQLEYLPVDLEKKLPVKRYIVADIKSFREHQPLYPVSKIL
ncbi:Nardilysin [Lamellibrachia satsuma]|nr:Nardilysin [Lamellibrachia satsuma]